jgi:hypothetical protein
VCVRERESDCEREGVIVCVREREILNSFDCS